MDMLRLLLLLVLAMAAPSLALPRKYKVVSESKKWGDAQRYCRDNFADLATFHTLEDWESVKQSMRESGLNALWIGLSEAIDSWKWSMDDTAIYDGSNTYSGSWFTFKRDNNGSDESCGTIQNGKLYDHTCSALFKSVCYDEPTDSYIPVSVETSWESAQSYCRQTYSGLASMRSQQERDYIMSVTDADSYWWLGLYRDTWKWSDQSSSTFRAWKPNEPNGGPAHCVLAEQSGWKDVYCSREEYFLCSVPIRKIFKVVVKPQQSLDLSNLQPQGALLIPMQHHMTLTWRKQANGQVFNKTTTHP